MIEQNKQIEELKKFSHSPDPSGKKIEELTLHVIEQEKNNRSLLDQISDLHKEMEIVKSKLK